MTLADPAHAQAPGPAPPAASRLDSPRVIALPPIEPPPGEPAPPDGRVEAVLEVAVDGSATLVQCEASAAVCARVREAVAAARFEPGRRDGKPIAARVRVAFAWKESAPEPAAPQPSGSPPPAPAEPAPAAPAPRAAPQPSTPSAPAAPAAPEPEPKFGARARVTPNQPGMRRLELAEMRDMPGAFGDPFRAVDALPGVVPALSGLPYFYIRGAPPAGTLYVYDDIAVPTLYHLAIGPAVIYPRMVGPIRLYSGVAPARYGRLTGGVIVGEGPAPPDGYTHAEAELRLLDVAAYAQTPVLGGDLTAAVRYGYPGLVLSLVSPTVTLQYWDYQLRFSKPLSAEDRIELVALGSYDSLGFTDQPQSNITITFHRLEPRFIRQVGRTEYGVAFLLGWDESVLGSGFQLRSTRVGPRFWVTHRFSDTTRLRISGDLIGVAGFFSAAQALSRMMNAEARASLFGDVPARSMWGVQAEFGFRPVPLLEFQLGARADAWVQGAGAEAVVDPRARVILHPEDELEFHVAAGVVHQPAVFYLPLPGIVDVATSRGLQTAIQSEAGVGWDTPLGLRAELQAFLHHYANLVFTDALFLQDSFDTICGTIACGNVSVPKRIDGYSYGGELFLKRPFTERLSGWLSYTLAYSAVDDVAGLPYTPTWDVRHVANLVLHWEMGAGWSSGARLQARSGKIQADFQLDQNLHLARNERRLPGFVRLDLDIAHTWHPSWGKLRLGLEWFNATFSREPLEYVCTGSPSKCKLVYLPAIVFPNLGLRGEI